MCCKIRSYLYCLSPIYIKRYYASMLLKDIRYLRASKSLGKVFLSDAFN